MISGVFSIFSQHGILLHLPHDSRQHVTQPFLQFRLAPVLEVWLCLPAAGQRSSA